VAWYLVKHWTNLLYLIISHILEISEIYQSIVCYTKHIFHGYLQNLFTAFLSGVYLMKYAKKYTKPSSNLGIETIKLNGFYMC